MQGPRVSAGTLMSGWLGRVPLVGPRNALMRRRNEPTKQSTLNADRICDRRKNRGKEPTIIEKRGIELPIDNNHLRKLCTSENANPPTTDQPDTHTDNLQMHLHAYYMHCGY